MIHRNTGFGAILYSAGTEHGHLHQLSVTTRRVTYFILQAHRGTYVSHSCSGKNEGKWTGKVEISKEDISGSRYSMHSYILTYSRVQEENL